MPRGKKNGHAEPDTASIGHNSNLHDDQKIKLAGFVEEIERLEAVAREINSKRGTVYKTAKEAGFDTKALRHTIRMRRMEKSKREEFENTCDAYAHALGDFASTALGAAMAPQQDQHA